MHSYFVPADSVMLTEEIKKSRFITYLAPAADVDTAKQFIQQIKSEHPDARHHCWAFIAGSPTDPQVLGFSDDGEPSGTAGKPILGQLSGSGIGEIVAVVVRYYGGILLGTGGLVKAYGGGVQQALKCLPLHRRVPEVEYQLQCSYPQLAIAEGVFQQYAATIVQIEYMENIALTVRLPLSDVAEIIEKLRDASRGSLHLLPVEPITL